MVDVDDLMAGLDAPHPLGSELRARLVDALDREPLLEDLDGPFPLPPDLRARLATAVTTPARAGRRDWRPFLAIAAVVVLVAGVSSVALRGGGRGTPRSSSVSGLAVPAPANSPAETGGATGSPSAPRQAVPLPEAAGGAASPGNGGVSSGLNATGGETSNSSTASGSGATPSTLGGPPPYAFSVGGTPAAASLAPAPVLPPGAAASSPDEAAAPPLPPVTVNVVGGDPQEVAGFNAYVSVLNQSGGGRPIRVASAPAAGAIVSVNLSDTPLGAGTKGPVLERLDAPQAILRTPVFDAAGSVEQQADAAVDATFPAKASGMALIYRGTSGVWAAEAPAALSGALRARGLTVVEVAYVPGQRLTALPAQAVFLSLSTGDARSWFGAAAAAGVHPALGVVGLSSIVEPSLASVMPAGTRAIGAYDMPGGAEQQQLAATLGAAPGMAAIHGWVTAKLLEIALWQSGATTASELTNALAGQVGYDDGWAPPLAFMPNTTVRVPAGVLYTVTSHGLTTDHRFVG